jgi:epoxide hydrolase-like predicted phosphatase
VIRTMIFDLGGVLVNVEPKRSLSRFQRLAASVPEEKILDIFEQSEIKRQYELGTIDSRVFFESVGEKLGVEISYDTFRELWTEIFSPIQPMIDLLPELKNRYRLALLSNTNPLHTNYCREHYHFFHHFHHLILSHEVGCLKPDESMYRIALERSESLPEECLFVDDLPLNVEAAVSLGMRTIEFSGYEPFLRDAARMGIVLDEV